MTTNTPAPAQDTVLTDAMILHRWACYVSEPSAVYPITDADKIAFARAIESALLSKLRAPVADERAAFEHWSSDDGENPAAVERSGHGYRLAQIQTYWIAWQARASLRAEHRCECCDGTGDVHSLDGEWRGTCKCPIGRALVSAPVAETADTELPGMWDQSDLSGGETDCAQASAPVAGKAKPDLAPLKCPITGRPFFMAIEHPELGMVPTYGGPYDSYTIPHLDGKPDQPWHERELYVYRYDHDLGGWRTDEVEVIPLRIVHENVLHDLEDTALQASEAVRVQQLEAARIAYAREFPPDENGDPDVGSIHANIRKLKSQLAALPAQPGAQKEKSDA